MVRGGTINTEESHNDTQSMIATLEQTTKTRHHNRSRKVRREIQQQQALDKPKDNAWTPTDIPTKNDEVRESDNDISRGPESSDSENDSGSESDSEKWLMLSQRQCTQEITGRRKKKKKKGSSKIKKTTSQSNRF
jgi:hypothetical protein